MFLPGDEYLHGDLEDVEERDQYMNFYKEFLVKNKRYCYNPEKQYQKNTLKSRKYAIKFVTIKYLFTQRLFDYLILFFILVSPLLTL